MGANKNSDLFSKEELQVTREDLFCRLEKIDKTSANTLTDLEKLGDDEFADPGDRAYLESERNLNLRIRDRERKLSSKIKSAIERIDANEYQICVECGEMIPKNRLLSRPVTDLCVSCKEKQEQKERHQKI